MNQLVVQQFSQYQHRILQKLKMVKDSSDSRIMYLLQLENLLFASLSRDFYAPLAESFFRIANILSEAYSGTQAAHHQIMSLFCDVQSSGNSLVAIKRRMQSVTRGEKIKHEVRNSLGLENFGSFLSVKPFGFFPVLQGECSEQTDTLLAGSYL